MRALKRGNPVVLTAVMFDVDCTGTHGTSAPVPESWRQEERAKVLRLFEAHGAGFFCETSSDHLREGFRIDVLSSAWRGRQRPG